MARARAYAMALLSVVAVFVATTTLAPILSVGDWLEPVALWANILALPTAFIVAELYRGGAFERADARASRLTSELEDLRDTVLEVEGRALGALIAVDRPRDTRRMNLTFTKAVLQYRSAGGAAACTLDNLHAYFQSLEPHRLVVLGESGAGKTVAALTLLKDMLDDPARRPGDPVPIRVLASGYRNQKTLQRWIVEVLSSNYNCRRATAAALVNSGKIVPVLDGLDELDSDPTKPERANAVVELANNFLHNGDPAHLIALCRSGVYAALAVGIEEATEISVDSVDEALFRSYLNDQFRHAAEDFSWQGVLDALSGTYGVAAQLQLQSAIASPWIVACALATSRAGTSPDSIFFSAPPAAGAATTRAIDDIRQTILSSFLRTRIAVTTDRLGSPYDAADVASWLRLVARHLRSEMLAGRPSELRLETWWRAARLRSRIAHGLTSSLLSLGCLSLIYFGVNGMETLQASQLRTYRTNIEGLEPAFTISIAVSMACAIGIVVTSVALAVRSDVVPLRLSIKSPAPGHGWLVILRFGLIGLILGALTGAEVAFLGGFILDARRSILLGAIFGLIASLVIGFCVSLARGRIDADNPASVISGDLAYGITIGAVVAASSALGGLLTIGVQFGALVGIATLTLFGLLWSPIASVRYFITTATLHWSQSRTPFRFAKMLNWAIDAGILRRAGSSFQFSHQDVQDALASGQI